MITRLKLANAMATFASSIAECTDYNWDANFQAEQVKKAMERLRKTLKETVDLTKLDKEELSILGFKECDNGIMLIPLYLMPNIPEGTEVFSIMGGKAIVGTDHIDNDVRGGCIAYGIYPKKREKSITVFRHLI